MTSPATEHSNYVYDDRFYSQADETAARSADGIISLIAANLTVRSVLDVGCGRGVWLASWMRHGAGEVVGIDGSYVDQGSLAIPASTFRDGDLSKPFSLERQFDLVQTLEVAEHIDQADADTFIENLARHGSIILFSAAIPGQGGEHHVNEQPWEYWRAKLFRRGFEVFDFVRGRVRHDESIYYCYRYNTFLYAHRDVIEKLPQQIRATHVPVGMPLDNVVPLLKRLRLTAVRILPRPIVDEIARAKYRVRARAVGKTKPTG